MVVKLEDSPSYFAYKTLGLDLYPWQVRSLEAIAAGRRVALRAANGSGKTARVIAVAILWFLNRYPKGRCAVISGSWMQVEKQLWPALELYRHHPLLSAWKWNHCNLITPEGGQAVGFSTDKAGRAEGWHGTEDSPVFYIVDEAKTVQDSIFTAIDRCTRQFCLYASSPGAPSGQFYRCFYDEAELFFPIVATAYDCPHIQKERIDEILKKYPENDPVKRSMIDAEFTNLDNELILTPEDLRISMQRFTEWKPGHKYGFIDFAAGRDENAIGKSNGNLVSLHKAWRDRDTVQAVRFAKKEFESLNIEAHNAWGDADGLGLPMIQQMREEGYRIKEFRGGMPAEDAEHYCNTISEAWFEFSRKIRAGEIILKECNPVLFKQLTTRRIKYDARGKLRAEPKEEMRERGLSSPDQADAVIGVAWAARGHKGAFTDDSDIITSDEEQNLIMPAEPQIW